MLLPGSYLKTGEYKKALLMNILSSTLIEIGKRGDVMDHEKWIREEGGGTNEKIWGLKFVEDADVDAVE